MRIIGPDELVFRVDHIEASEAFPTEYGLTPVGDRRFNAIDNTAICVRSKDDLSLPAPMRTVTILRQTTWVVGRAQFTDTMSQPRDAFVRHPIPAGKRAV